MSIYNEPPPGMCIVPDKEDITKVCVQGIVLGYVVAENQI